MRLTLEDQLEKLSITATEADHARLDRELVKASDEIREEAVLSSLRDAVCALKQITKRVLVLGLGSLVGATASSSMLQLAMVVEVLELLGRKEEIDVVFRDPAFTGVDVAFLEKHERWTVEDALKKHAKDLETTPTVLIAPHLDFDVLAAHLGSTHLPILLLSNDLQHYMDLLVYWQVGTEGSANLSIGVSAMQKSSTYLPSSTPARAIMLKNYLLFRIKEAQVLGEPLMTSGFTGGRMLFGKMR
jgi:hypothetical protein